MNWTMTLIEVGGVSWSALEALGAVLAVGALIALYFSSFRSTLYWFVGGMCYWIGIELVAGAISEMGIKDSTAYLSSISVSLALTVLWLGISEIMHPETTQNSRMIEHTPLNGEVPTSSG